MTVPELARLCSEQIIDRLANTPRLTDAERLAVVESYVRGAINRAVEEAAATHEVVHVHGSLGAVDVKLTKSTQGVSLEIDVKRPREPGEGYEQAAEASAKLAARAYDLANAQLGMLGLTPGREPKA